MSEALIQLAGNLSHPAILGFGLGVLAFFLRGDVRLPESVHAALASYLLLAIGLKGGVALTSTPGGELALPILVTLALGCATPVWCYAALRRMLGFSVPDAAALAAHYGSASIVTFTASVAYLEALGVPHESFMSALVAILEVPAILIAILLARRSNGSTAPLSLVLREVLTGRSILLLAGGMLMGLLTGAEGMRKVEPFFVAPFAGALTLFLMDMGAIAASRMRDLGQVGGRLIAFAILAPLAHAVVGAWLGKAANLSVGGTALLATMAASASYIAAPVAVRLALPTANPALYLTAALALTFPLNLVIGIPFHAMLAHAFHD